MNVILVLLLLIPAILVLIVLLLLLVVIAVIHHVQRVWIMITLKTVRHVILIILKILTVTAALTPQTALNAKEMLILLNKHTVLLVQVLMPWTKLIIFVFLLVEGYQDMPGQPPMFLVLVQHVILIAKRAMISK